MSLDNPERIPNPKGWYNHDHTEMFHGIMPVQGGAHRPRLEEWLPFSRSGFSLHPCATAIVQAHSRQRRRSYSRRSIFTSPASHAALGCSRIPLAASRPVFRSTSYSHAPRSLRNTSHCKPKSGTMGRQRLYPST